MIPGVSMRPEGGAYVFVSYASKDRARVLGVVETLREAGVAAWLDQADIAGGTSYGPEIAAGIEGCGAVTLMCSAASLASRNVRQEIQLAWRYSRPILPLLLEPVTFPDDLSYWLEGAQWVEVLDRAPEAWLPAVLRALAIVGVVEAAAGPGAAGPAGPAVVAVAPPAVGNLPVVPGLVGRVQELAQVRTLATNHRLVTLTGPGGTGKTRLAVEAALRLAEGFADGAWLVDLAALTDAELVPAAVLTTLGGRAEPGQTEAEALRAHLAERTLLLVLDNLEQIPGVAPLLAGLVGDAPGLTVLATSRVPLRAAGEVAFAVPPLEAPDPNRLPPLPELAANPAVRLFVDRAREARPDFALSAANAPSVAAICARLDGLPLAIELAAARVRLLPPPALLARLGSRLNVLTRGLGASPRQQTMRATIAWSHDLLDPAQQAVFRRLGVFAGGCDLGAAEAVSRGVEESRSRDGTDHLDSSTPRLLDSIVLDALDALVDHGLLRAEGGGEEERPRVRMLETIREFALETLTERDEEAETRRAHAGHFLALAEATEPDLTGTAQAQALARLDADHDNLRAALDWLLGVEESRSREVEGAGPFSTPRLLDSSTDGLRLSAALWRFWLTRGHLAEGRRRLEAALDRGDGAPPDARAGALEGAGVLADTQGDHDRAETLHAEALALYRAAGDDLGAARSLDNLGIAAEGRDDLDGAVERYEAALALRRAAGDERGIAVSLHQLSYVALTRGDLAAAEPLAAESLARLRRVGDTRGIAFALQNLGMLATRSSDFARAAAYYEENLALNRTLGDPHGAAFSLVNLGRARALAGDPAAGIPAIEEAVPVFRDLGDGAGTAWALWALAHARARAEEPERAVALFLEALDLYLAARDGVGLAEGLEGLGGVLCGRGDAVEGITLLAAAEALRERIGVPLPEMQRLDYDRGLTCARDALDPATFADAWAIGRIMAPEQAVAEAALARR